MTDERSELQDFPTLDRWGDELRDATKRKEAGTDRFRLPIRRIVVAMAVMLVAVPGAIATRSIWVDPIDRLDPARDPNSTPAVLLAEGEVDGVQWQLGAFDRSHGTQCVQLQTLRNRGLRRAGCTQPLGGSASLTAGAGTDGRVGFLYGTVTARAAKVRVTVPGGRTTVATTIQPDPESLRRAGLSDRRVYVASFAGGFDPTSGAPLVVVLDDEDREIARFPRETKEQP